MRRSVACVLACTRASTLASTLACIVACGGTQAGPSSDAGPDQTAMPLLAPTEMAACAESQTHTFQPIVGFEDSDSPQTIGGRTGNQLAGTYTTFISYDETGKLFQPLVPGSAQETEVTPSGCTTGWQPHLGSDTGSPPPTPRCGSDRQALHLHGDGLNNWGMNIGVDLRQNCNCDSMPGDFDGGVPPACGQRVHPELGCQTYCSPPHAHCFFDATGWTGISFWAMQGPASTGTTALITVMDPNTAGQSGGNDPADQKDAYPFNDLLCGNPPCAMGPDGGVVDAGNDCTSTTMPLCLCDPYGRAFGLVPHWEFYAIPFSEMRQKGYGKPEAALDLAHIIGLRISLGKGNWDVWLDDIAFYK